MQLRTARTRNKFKQESSLGLKFWLVLQISDWIEFDLNRERKHVSASEHTLFFYCVVF